MAATATQFEQMHFSPSSLASHFISPANPGGMTSGMRGDSPGGGARLDTPWSLRTAALLLASAARLGIPASSAGALPAATLPMVSRSPHRCAATHACPLPETCWATCLLWGLTLPLSVPATCAVSRSSSGQGRAVVRLVGDRSSFRVLAYLLLHC